jgi:hypothetical protein
MLFGKLINFLKEPMNEERLTSACNLTSSHCHLLCKKPHKNRHWPPAVEAGVKCPYQLYSDSGEIISD